MEVRISRTAVATLITAVCLLATEMSLVAAKNELNNCKPPSILREDEQTRNFIKETEVDIACIANGDGKLSYQWLKDGETIDLSSESSKSRMTTATGAGSLIIFNAVPEDEGRYQCVVVNNCGTAMSTVTLLLHAYLDPFPPSGKPTVIKGVLGSSAILTCNPPHSEPKAIVDWILDDATGKSSSSKKEKNTGGGIMGFKTVSLSRRITKDYDGNLYITSLRKEDEQNGKSYVCVANNNEARSFVKGDDKVIITTGKDVADMGVDLMWRSDEKNLVLEGGYTKFKCIFSGQPEPEITWRRVGGEWDDSRFVVDHHELSINNVQYEDAGEYTCSGRNSLNPKAKTYTFTLEVKASPQWRVTPRDADASVDESASFVCDAVGNPTPSVQWFINGKPYSKDTTKGVLNGNTLVFNNLVKEDSQVIQCNASNIYGYIWSDVYLFVEALPPEISVKPKDNLVVARDTNVTLTCEVTGKPTPKLVWYRGKQPLNHERFVVQNSGNLFIQKAALRDTGTYICKAENRFGKAEAAGTLSVRDKTEIVTPPVSERVDFNNQATFTCGAKTDNKEMENLRIRWLKNGAPVSDPDNRIKMDGGVITISDTKSTDTGSYTCVAENRLDRDTATATLEVKAPPDPPYDLMMSECLDSAVVLTWKFDEKMSNFAIMISYIIETKNNYEPDKWTKAFTPDYPSNTASLSLSPYAKYWFRIKAVNKMGTGEPSKEASSHCETLMAAPDKNPANVRTDEKDTGFLVIKWEAMDLIDLNGKNFQYELEIEDTESQNVIKHNITDHKINEYRMPVESVYSPYLISVRSRNIVGQSIFAPEKVKGYSGEAAPLAVVDGFEVDPDINVTATMAGFRWNPVSTEPEVIRGKFQGYKIRYWKKGAKDTSMHHEIIPSTEEDSRKKRSADQDGYVRGRVVNLPSFSEIIADVVVINTNFESEGSNQVNIVTPEGVPGAVKSLEALSRGLTHIILGWEPPKHPNGIIKAYEISYRKIDSLDFGDLEVDNDEIASTKTQYTLKGLEEDSQYRIYIKAKTIKGWGKDYFIDVVTGSQFMDPDENGDLAQPLIQKVDAFDNDANVTWTVDMSKEGRRRGLIYYLQHKKRGDKEWTTSEESIEDRTWAYLDHLDPGTTYQVRVVAKDDAGGKHEPSKIQMFHTTGVGAARASFLSAAWFIGMMIAIAILILILIIVCIIKRNRGDNYPVQEKERLRGNCDDNHDNFNGFGKGSDENGIGVSSSFDRDGEKVPLDVDADSMDYGDDDASRFNEDGSFIGQYGTGDKANDVANVSASSIV